MVELDFALRGVAPASWTATPTLELRVGVATRRARISVANVLLRCTVRLEAGARVYTPEERSRLRELFGEGSVWERAARSLVWTQATCLVPGFEGETEISVALPCSYDLAALSSKYLRALECADVPITAQFSGSIFYQDDHGLRVMQIGWDSEAVHRVPVSLWREAMAGHFPNAGILTLDHDTYQRLDHYRTSHGFLDFEHALESLLAASRGDP